MPLFHTKKGFLKAAAEGNVPLLQEYLGMKGKDWLWTTEKDSNKTALHRAATAGHVAAVQFLLANRGSGPSDFVGREIRGENALDMAIIRGHAEVVRLLLAEADCLAKGISGARIFNALYYKERLGILKDLVATGKADLEAERNPAVYSAASTENIEGLKFLLDQGANPNVPHHPDPDSPWGRIWEERKGFVTKEKKNCAESPLFRAVRCGYTEIAGILLQAGARVTNQELPLHCAAFSGNLALAERLIAAGTGLISAVNAEGRTALHLAVEKNHPEMVKFLLAQGADPCAADHNGRTPIALARQFALGNITPLLENHDPAAVRPVAIVPAEQSGTAVIRAVPRLLPAPESPAHRPETAAPPAAATGADDDTWTLSGKSRLSRAYTLPGRRLTEIFNFDTRERIIFGENLALKTETMGPAESFDAITEEALMKALTEFRRQGGKTPEADVFKNRLVKTKPGLS